MDMNRYVVMLVIISFHCLTKAYSIDSTVGIILAVKRFFNSGCVSILYPEDTSIEWLVAVHHQLSRANIATAIIPVENGAPSISSCRSCPALNVILSDSTYWLNSARLRYQIESPGPVWLFFQGSIYQENIFHDLYIPMDCEVVVVKLNKLGLKLIKLYQMDRLSPLQENIIFQGSLHELHQTSFSSINAKRFKQNLLGREFKVSVIHNPPLSCLKYSNNVYNVQGFLPDLLTSLSTIMNFQVQYIIPPEQTFGGDLGNGSWSGMVGSLLRNESDLALGVASNLERRTVIDFSVPIIFLSYRAFLQDPGNMTVFWGNFISPFSHTLWLGITSCFVISSLVLFLSNFLLLKTNDLQQFNFLTSTLLDSVFKMFTVIFCQQGHSRTSPHLSSRIVILLMLYISVVLYNAYAGALISHTAVKRLGKLYDSIDDLLKDGSYKAGTVKGSARRLYFTEFVLRNRSDVEEFPDDYTSGFKEVCKKKFAFIVPQSISDMYMKNATCKITSLHNVITSANMAYGFNKNSRFLHSMNSWLLKLQTAGITNRLKRLAWPQHFEIESMIFSSIQMKQTLPAVTTLVFGIAMSFLILIIEITVHRSHRQYK